MKTSGIRNTVLTFALAGSFTGTAQTNQHPNVLLIITDDQGYGDLSITGNPHLKTPEIDNLAKESVRLDNFYVCPVSAPTRASLMTGRYSLRTGVHDTYNGGAIMASSEVTIAEMLKGAGYTTGTFINQQRIRQGGITELEMSNITFPDMTCDLIPFYLVNSKKILPFWVEIERVN
jgi:membrane-anchored protein YejM (alkaline phosphatase superfamily)